MDQQTAPATKPQEPGVGILLSVVLTALLISAATGALDLVIPESWDSPADGLRIGLLELALTLAAGAIAFVVGLVAVKVVRFPLWFPAAVGFVLIVGPEISEGPASPLAGLGYWVSTGPLVLLLLSLYLWSKARSSDIDDVQGDGERSGLLGGAVVMLLFALIVSAIDRQSILNPDFGDAEPPVWYFLAVGLAPAIAAFAASLVTAFTPAARRGLWKVPALYCAQYVVLSLSLMPAFTLAGRQATYASTWLTLMASAWTVGTTAILAWVGESLARPPRLRPVLVLGVLFAVLVAGSAWSAVSEGQRGRTRGLAGVLDQAYAGFGNDGSSELAFLEGEAGSEGQVTTLASVTRGGVPFETWATYSKKPDPPEDVPSAPLVRLRGVGGEWWFLEDTFFIDSPDSKYRGVPHAEKLRLWDAVLRDHLGKGGFAGAGEGGFGEDGRKPAFRILAAYPDKHVKDRTLLEREGWPPAESKDTVIVVYTDYPGVEELTGMFRSNPDLMLTQGRNYVERGQRDLGQTYRFGVSAYRLEGDTWVEVPKQKR